MKIKQSPSSFNLPVLLSFNELAWIAIFGMALACVYAWRQIDEIPVLKQKLSEQFEIITNLQNASNNFVLIISKLTYQIAECERDNKRLTVLLEEQRKETASFSNLWERAIATNGVLTRANDKLADDLAAKNAELAEFRRQLAELKDENRRFSDRLPATPAPLPIWEGQVRQELLSLKGGAAGGSLSNVVVLLDRSSSMDAENGGRWRDATNVVNTWLNYLPIKNCVLVTFNEHPIAFPTDGSWLRIDETNRNMLVAQLNGLRPEGFTDTLAALQMAYRYTNVDTIILFTDGKPERAPRNGSRQESFGGSGSKQMIKDIHLLCTNRAHIIPINTVGLGDYFNPDLAGFLRQLANESKGTFIGR